MYKHKIDEIKIIFIIPKHSQIIYLKKSNSISKDENRKHIDGIEYIDDMSMSLVMYSYHIFLISLCISFFFYSLYIYFF